MTRRPRRHRGEQLWRSFVIHLTSGVSPSARQRRLLAGMLGAVCVATVVACSTPPPVELVIVAGTTAPAGDAPLPVRPLAAGPIAPAAPGGDSAFGSAEVVDISRTEAGYVSAQLGCLGDLSVTTLDETFSKSVGPIIGFDNVHVYPLGGDRFLWLTHDTYIDYRGRATTLHDARPLPNLALLQEGSCFTMLHQGTTDDLKSFELGTGLFPGRFFWPLGGEIHDGKVLLFWSETITTDHLATSSEADGLTRQPASTWLATYDAITLERLDFRPAPNPGITPQYGFAVASDDTHSYLFGNSNMLDLRPAGGFYAGPHSATRMYLARVPRGRLDLVPEYRTGDGWSSDPAAAVPISERFWVENTMQPRFIDGQWVAVTKKDGFWGEELVIDVADQPWGPWRTVTQTVYVPRQGSELANSYQPVLLPFRNENGNLTVVMSENHRDWPQAMEDPSFYRPRVFEVEWPVAAP